MARFSGIPSIPEGVAGEWQSTLLEAMKENIELLTGQRGERDASSRAVTKGDIAISSIPASVFSGVTARGDGFSVGSPSVDVAGLADYVKLINDVRLLSAEVQRLRLTIDALIKQLRK